MVRKQFGRGAVIVLFAMGCVIAGGLVHGGAPTADLKVGGSDGPVTISPSSMLDVQASLTLDANVPPPVGDWWIVVDTSFGVFHLDLDFGWMPGVEPTHQGEFFDIDAFSILKASGLPEGSYTFYFGGDNSPNSMIDDNLFYDSIEVTISRDALVGDDDDDDDDDGGDTGTTGDGSGDDNDDTGDMGDTGDAGDGGTTDDQGDTGSTGDTGDTSHSDDTTITVKWVVPDTNQTASYTSTYGEDSDFLINPPSYTDNGDGTITDNVTGLMWTQDLDLNGDGTIDAEDKLTYGEAPAYAASVITGGYTDWRVPTIKELYSLMDFRGQDISGYSGTDTSGLTPFIDTRYFKFGYGDDSAGERLIDSQMVTSTKYVSTTMGGNETMFGVNFADGRIKGYPTAMKEFYAYFVRDPKGVNYGENEFVDNGDGTVTDSATGKMWSRDDSGQGLNWEEALAWVNTKNSENYLGYSDWRLPNAKELQSIVDYSRSPDTTDSAAIDPAFNTTEITNEGGEKDWPWFWSSTTALKYNSHTGEAMADQGVYVCFGRALGYNNNEWQDVHGAGCQRTDPKAGNPSDYPTGFGPQGDAIRIYNYVRLIRDVTGKSDGGGIGDTSDSGDTGSGSDVGAGEDYTLFGTQGGAGAYLIDSSGTAVYTWSPSSRLATMPYLLDDGDLIYPVSSKKDEFDANASAAFSSLQRLAPDASVEWEYTLDSADDWMHHDVEPLPNGNVLVIVSESITYDEAIALGRKPSLLGTDDNLWADAIYEIKPSGTDDGQIVWKWRVWDHLVQDYSASAANYGDPTDNPGRIDLNYAEEAMDYSDWTHCNGIDYNAALDQIVISSRTLSEIWIIDHDTTTAEAAGSAGDLLYRWGNAAVYGGSSDQKLYGQHDPQWIPDGYPGAGDIIVFSNGTGRPDGNYSTVEQVTPPLQSDGTYSLTSGVYGPSVSTWTYTATPATSLYADHISGCQRLANGNTLVIDGPNGKMREVTDAGETVWTYANAYPATNPTGTSMEVFKARRHLASDSGVQALLATK